MKKQKGKRGRKGGRKVGGVGAMKDKELKLKDIDGGTGEGRVQGRGKWRGCRSYSGVRNTLSVTVTRWYGRTFSFTNFVRVWGLL